MRSKATMSFNYLLSRLPANEDKLSSDACSSFGMAGVLLFAGPTDRYPGCEGLFWQSSWKSWERVVTLPGLAPGQIKICVAEFLAALITIETFATNCVGKLTYLELDNTTAHAWFETARCPRFPFDRCAQSTHLYMLEKNIKVRTRWITSGENKIADRCSRVEFCKGPPHHAICGLRMLKIKPRWKQVLKFIK